MNIDRTQEESIFNDKGNNPSDCLSQSLAIIYQDRLNNGSATLRRVCHRYDKLGRRRGFGVKHRRGNYRFHYVVQKGDKILDPFLPEEGPIPIEEYLARAYKNPKALEIMYQNS